MTVVYIIEDKVAGNGAEPKTVYYVRSEEPVILPSKNFGGNGKLYFGPLIHEEPALDDALSFVNNYLRRYAIGIGDITIKLAKLAASDLPTWYFLDDEEELERILDEPFEPMKDEDIKAEVGEWVRNA